MANKFYIETKAGNLYEVGYYKLRPDMKAYSLARNAFYNNNVDRFALDIKAIDNSDVILITGEPKLSIRCIDVRQAWAEVVDG